MKNGNAKSVVLISLLAVCGGAIGVCSMGANHTLESTVNASSPCALTFDTKRGVTFGQDYIQKSHVRLGTTGLTKQGKNMTLASGGIIETKGEAYKDGLGGTLNEINTITINIASGNYSLYTAYTSTANFVEVEKNITQGTYTFNSLSYRMRKPRYFKIVANEETVINSFTIDCGGSAVTNFNQLEDGQYVSHLKYYLDEENIYNDVSNYQFTIKDGLIQLPGTDMTDLLTGPTDMHNFYPAIEADITNEDTPYNCEYLPSLDELYSKDILVDTTYFHYNKNAQRIDARFLEDALGYEIYGELTGISKVVDAVSLDVSISEGMTSKPVTSDINLTEGAAITLKAKARGENFKEPSFDITWKLPNTNNVKFKGSLNSTLETKNDVNVTLEAVKGTTNPVELTVSCGSIEKVVKINVEAAAAGVHADLVGTWYFDDGMMQTATITINNDGSGKIVDSQYDSEGANETWPATDVTINSDGTVLTIDSSSVKFQITLTGSEAYITGDVWEVRGSQLYAGVFDGIAGVKQ